MQVTAQDERSATPPAPRRRWTRWLLAVLLLAGVGLYAAGLHRYMAWDYVRGQLDALQGQVRANLPLAVAAFFLLYVAATALSLPAAAVLSLAAGALFGRWLGTGVAVVAASLGATLAFLSSRYLFRDWVQQHWAGTLEALNRGVERDGVYYLFGLRLVPAFPFFLINLGMGLTRMRVGTFFWVSLLGMLPGAFLYVNAGTALAGIDSPAEVLSPIVLGSLALLGLAPLGFRLLVRRAGRPRLRTVALAAAAVVLLAAVALAARTYFRYRTAPVMEVAVKEFSNAEYPEDPATRSIHFGQYDGRRLTLEQKDDTHFDFLLEPTAPGTARVVFRDVDVSLMTPGLPEWTKADAGLRRIALTDRQWNRQQVAFGKGPARVEVTGGDGFEAANLASAELAKNCLNAGLWEVLLFVQEGGKKALYYHGWFTFPLGHYGRLFERNTGLPYWRHWYYLEHWADPAGTVVSLDGLRHVVEEREVPATFDPAEPIRASGEQQGKRRTTVAENLRTWGDFYDGRRVRFAAFIPPGRYSVAHPWKNEFGRLAHFDRAVLRTVVSPASDRPLAELELIFEGRQGGRCRFLVSGFDLAAVPRLAADDYPKGLYMPMGIGVPPFNQTYDDLRKAPPARSPYFSLLLDDAGRWINHHEVAVDGPVLHRDAKDPTLLHVYLLSYERHSLVAHFLVPTGS